MVHCFKEPSDVKSSIQTRLYYLAFIVSNNLRCLFFRQTITGVSVGHLSLFQFFGLAIN